MLTWAKDTAATCLRQYRVTKLLKQLWNFIQLACIPNFFSGFWKYNPFQTIHGILTFWELSTKSKFPNIYLWKNLFKRNIHGHIVNSCLKVCVYNENFFLLEIFALQLRETFWESTIDVNFWKISWNQLIFLAWDFQNFKDICCHLLS